MLSKAFNVKEKWGRSEKKEMNIWANFQWWQKKRKARFLKKCAVEKQIKLSGLTIQIWLPAHVQFPGNMDSKLPYATWQLFQLNYSFLSHVFGWLTFVVISPVEWAFREETRVYLRGQSLSPVPQHPWWAYLNKYVLTATSGRDQDSFSEKCFIAKSPPYICVKPDLLECCQSHTFLRNCIKQVFVAIPGYWIREAWVKELFVV